MVALTIYMLFMNVDRIIKMKKYVDLLSVYKFAIAKSTSKNSQFLHLKTHGTIEKKITIGTTYEESNQSQSLRTSINILPKK